MKKSFVFSLLLIILCSVFLLVPHTQAEGDSDMELAEILRNKDTERDAACEQTEVDEVWQLKNQAASRDADLVWRFLDKNPESVLHQYFSGMYIDESSQLIVNVFGEENACRKQLTDLGLETKVLVKKETESYYAVKERLSHINAKIIEINEHVQNACGTDEESAFMGYRPCISYYDQSNSILVQMAVIDENDFAYAKGLFIKLVGSYEALSFEACGKDELNFSFYLSPVQPGRGIYISGASDYSLGFRAYYMDGVNKRYGMITAAHGNAIGQSVYFASTTTNIGSITLRQLSTNIDAAFVQLGGNYGGSQTIYSTSPSEVLDSYISTPTTGTTIYKVGAATGKTGGTVASTSYNATVGTQYITDMISVASQIASTGDSGGITYMVLSGTSRRTVGGVEGGDSTVTLFLKAAAIELFLGVHIY